jgi:alkylation response protein AidB-like acyl-CoA dehydrogenase
VDDWDKQAVTNNHVKCGEYIKTMYSKSAKYGILPACVGKPWPKKYTSAPEPEGYDYFHELINVDEGTRAGGGIAWAMMGGLGIGMPPILNFGIPGDRALQDRCIRECLAGEKIICLCITEPGAGSDVSNLQCTAKDAGDHYVVEGNKKWITNGIYADYFTVAVRTGPPGSMHKGLSMLLMEKSMPGITVSKMDCMGVWPSGTTYIEFDNVKVPKTNIVGKVNEGFKQVMYNFNHERWLLAAQAARMARTCGGRSGSFSSSTRRSSTRSARWRASARGSRPGSRTSRSR